jgi:UDP-N-acetylglucosamine transferase subunit ALG13
LIFVTVGGQTPFDRLVTAVDRWAEARGRDDVFAQIGRTDLVPSRIRFANFLPPEEFRRTVREAELVVGHAGMGTILTALELQRPLLVLPRRAALRETRNDHQLATAKEFAARGILKVGWDEAELAAWLDRAGEIAAGPRIPPHATPPLLEALRRFVNGL